MNLQNKL